MSKSYWGDGSQWAPAGIPQATGYWGSGEPETSGRPVLRVSIGGTYKRVLSASWRHGRPGWFAELEPTSATVTVMGTMTHGPGATVMIHSGAGVHWKGYVQSVTSNERIGEPFTTTITATDILGRSAQAFAVVAFTFGDDLTEQLEDVYSAFGMTAPTITYASSTRTLPVLDGFSGTQGTLGEVLSLVERSANAVFFFRTDATLVVLLRGALDAASVEVIPLDGDDAPVEWQSLRDPTTVINHWYLEGSSSVWYDEEDAASIALYGRHTFSISPDYLYNDADPFTAGLQTAMAGLRTIVPHALFRVRDYGQHVPWALPLDWVSRDDVLYQVLMVEHTVTPSEWTVAMFLDTSQSAIEDEPEPDPDDPPDPTVTVVEQTYTADRDSVVVRHPSPIFQGAGAGDQLQVGYEDRFRARTLLHFPMTPSGGAAGATGIRKATLRVKTSTQVVFTFGSFPKVRVKRLTGSWSEGSETTASADNAVVWPGPDATSVGAVVKSVTTDENTWAEFNVTEIARAHFTGSNHGFRLEAENEDWHGNATEFQSSEGGTNDPELVVKWEVPV